MNAATTTRDTAAATGGQVETHPMAWRPVLMVAAAVAAAHTLAAGIAPGRWYDEALQLAIGRHHLDWGSVDQPPITPLLALLADTLAPGSPLALAAPAIAANALAVLLAAVIARELGGNPGAQTLTALAQATGLSAALVGHWLTPYSLEPAFWLALGWLLVRWVRTRDDRLLLAAGLVAGAGAQTKFHIPVFAAVLLASVAACGPRAMLTRPLLWAGAALAVVIAAPTLAWQHTHGWPQAKMAPAIAAQADVLYGGRDGVARWMLVNAGLLGAALGAVGLAALLARPAWRPWRFFGAATLAMTVLYLVPPGRPTYIAGVYGVLAAAGAVTLQARRERDDGTGWAVWPVTALSVVLAAGTLHQSTVQASPAVADRVVEVTARAWHGLPEAQQARTVLWADTFMYAAYLDTAAPGTALPPAHSGSVAYGHFPAPPETADAALLVGADAGWGPTTLAALRPFFAHARPVAKVNPGPGTAGLIGGGQTSTLWLLTGRKVPWTTIHAAVRYGG